jgi:hypothetical protein
MLIIALRLSDVCAVMPLSSKVGHSGIYFKSPCLYSGFLFSRFSSIQTSAFASPTISYNGNREHDSNPKRRR